MLTLQSHSRFPSLQILMAILLMKQNILVRSNPSKSQNRFFLFADESGFTTSQKKDGHVGGQQFVVEEGSLKQLHQQQITNLPCFHSL